MSNNTITIKHDLSTEFIGDVLVTAFDGQYGGCWYWAEWAPEAINLFTVEVSGGTAWSGVSIRRQREFCEPEERFTLMVDAGIIVKGIQKILNEGNVNNAIVESIRRGVADDDAGEIDADAADVIVQVGLFGEVVYG